MDGACVAVPDLKFCPVPVDRAAAHSSAEDRTGYACHPTGPGRVASYGSVDAGNRLVDRGDPPSAVVASSDVLAIGLLHAARDRRVRVPEDLAVVGYGALDVSDLIESPLATVALPALEMGRLAMESG